MNDEKKLRHLEPEDFFLLALPPAGEPEVLPAHLSACAICARQFAEWQRAARELGPPEDSPSSEFERDVMERVKASPRPRSRRIARRVRVGLAAAACLAGSFFLGTRMRQTPPRPTETAAVSAMSESDLADDELLRDVSRLVSDEDRAPWKAVAPLPESTEGIS